jgi:hypothetical protein
LQLASWNLLALEKAAILKIRRAFLHVGNCGAFAIAGHEQGRDEADKDGEIGELRHNSIACVLMSCTYRFILAKVLKNPGAATWGRKSPCFIHKTLFNLLILCEFDV